MNLIIEYFIVHSLLWLTIICLDNDMFDGGTPCISNSECFSGRCYNEFRTSSFCAPDGPINGTMAAGSICTSNSQCFSNYCSKSICASDSRSKGKIAAGGICTSNSQCYSGYCRDNRCLAEISDMKNDGLLAAGAECLVHEQCFSGYCHTFRCGPDGRDRNLIPSGGTCSHNSQCSSNVCYNDRCSPENYNRKERGKVADGGRCKEDEQCARNSRCDGDTCVYVPKIKSDDTESSYAVDMDEESENDDHEDDDDPKIKPGGRCVFDDECVANAPCVFNRCSPISPVNNSLIADGGRCLYDQQCASGQCHGEICSVSYASLSATGWVAAGSYCRENRNCFSFLCVKGKCSADSYADNPITRHPLAAELHANRVAAGGFCISNSDCYSDLCTSASVCAPDGPQLRTIASGGPCTIDSDCFSGYCYHKQCVVADQTPGRVAPGGRCKTTDMCAPGSMCVDSFCKRPKDGVRRLVLAAGSVRLNDFCWMHAQCSMGRCLSSRCRLPANLVERSGTSKSATFNLVMIFAFAYLVYNLW